MFDIPFLIGALIASPILTLLLHAFSRSWPTSYGKVIFLSIIAAILAVLLAAVGGAEAARRDCSRIRFLL